MGGDFFVSRKLLGLRPLSFFTFAECSVKNEERNQLVVDTPKKSLQPERKVVPIYFWTDGCYLRQFHYALKAAKKYDRVN